MNRGLQFTVTTIIVIVILIITLLAIVMFFSGGIGELSEAVGTAISGSTSATESSPGATEADRIKNFLDISEWGLFSEWQICILGSLLSSHD